MKEHETKVIDINKDDLIKALESLGAEKKQDSLQRRWVFDPTVRSKDNTVVWWLRLRTDGKTTTLTKKSKTFDSNGISLHTEEVETVVSDFDSTATILNSLEWQKVLYQENRRLEYVYNDISFSIDEWPLIPTYLEVESDSDEKVKQGLQMLGLLGKDVGDLDVSEIYKRHGYHLNGIKELKF